MANRDTATKEEAAPQQKASAGEVEEMVRLLGLVFSNTFLYGANHTVTQKAQADSFVLVERILQRCGEVAFSVSENELLVNGDGVELKNPLMKAFVTKVTGLELSNFALLKGLSLEKYNMLIEVMNAKPEEVKAAGGFASVLASVGIDNVRTRTVVYKAVADDDVVISKQTLDKAAGPGGDKEQLDRVVEFLRGGSSAADEGAAGKIRSIAANTGQLGELIMKAAAGSGGAEGQAEAATDASTVSLQGTSEEKVTECVRKVYGQLSSDPAAKTQKGKKELIKILQTLETDLVGKLQEKEGDGNSGKLISGAVDQLVDELKIESLADEYMKKRMAIDENEKRILRFIKSKGLDKITETELEQRLRSGGLPPEGWHELLVRSGARSDDMQAEAGRRVGMVSMGSLAILLSRMEKTVAEGKDDKAKLGKIGGMLAEIDRRVGDILSSAEKKIDSLASETDEGRKDGAESTSAETTKKASMSKKELVRLLAEIVQELCQPLAVVDCSIEMVKSGNTGMVSDAQMEMLVLAESNSARMKKLIDRLLMVSGVPKTMTPDEDIIESCYKS